MSVLSQKNAAIRYITSGFYEGIINEYAQEPVEDKYAPVAARIAAMFEQLKACTAKAKEPGNQEYLDLCSRHLYEMTAYVIMCHLLLQDTQRAPELFAKSLTVFMNYAESKVMEHNNYITRLDVDQLEAYRQA